MSLQIQWRQIDPQIAARVGERMTTTMTPQATSVEEADAEESEAFGIGWTVVVLFLTVCFATVYFAICLNLAGPLATLVLSLVPVLLFVAIVAPGGLARVFGANTAHGDAFPPQAWDRLRSSPRLRAAFDAVLTSRAERLYGEVVLLLSDPSIEGDDPLDARTARDILRQCNLLVRDSFRLEQKRRLVRDQWNDGASLSRAEAEHADLIRRLAEARDPMTRHSLRESIGLCAERVENIRALEPILSRLDAHIEVICQALSLAQSAVARAQSVPATLRSPDISDLRQTVRRVSEQTRAVEEAVSEITLL